MPQTQRLGHKKRAQFSPYFIRRLSSWLVLSTALTVGLGSTARAANLYWDSNANAADGATDGGGTWNGNPTFFNPLNGVDIATGATDIAIFGNGGYLTSVATVNVGTQTIGGLVFGATDLDGYTLTNTAASTLTIGSSGITVNVGAQPTMVGSTLLSLSLGAAQTWANNSSNLLTIAGNVSNGGNTLTLASGPGSGGITITGIIGNGAGGVTVNSTGGGVVTLSGTDTYTGVSTLTAGLLRATNASAFGTGALQLNGGTLELLGGLSYGNATNVSVTSIQSDNATLGAGGTATLGALSLGSTVSTTAASSSSTTLTVSSTAGLGIGETVTGSGIAAGTTIVSISNGTQIVLSTANTVASGVSVAFGGTLTESAGAFVNSGTAGITAGNVTLGASPATINTNGSFTSGGVITLDTLGSVTGSNVGLTINDNSNSLFGTGSAASVGNTIINGTLSLGTGSLTKNGLGSLTLNGTADAIGGGITLTSGTLTLGQSATWSGGTGPALSFGSSTTAGAGTFIWDAPTTGTNTLTMGALTTAPTAGGGGDSTVESLYGVAGTATLVFTSSSSTFTRAAGGTVNFVTVGGTNGTTNSIKFSTALTTGFINQGTFFGGSNYAAYDAGGFLRAYAPTDANAVTSPVGATLGTTTSASNIFLNGNIGAEPTASVNTINDTGNFDLAQAAGSTLTINGILKSGNVGGLAVIAGGSITPASGAELVIRTDGVNDTLSISSLIIANGTNIVTKSGAGTLILSGLNTFTGDFYLNGGQLISSMTNAATGNLGTQANVSTTFKNLFITNNAVFTPTVSFNDNVPSSTNLAIAFNIGAGGGTLNTPTGILLTIDDGSGAGTGAGNAELARLRRYHQDGNGHPVVGERNEQLFQLHRTDLYRRGNFDFHGRHESSRLHGGRHVYRQRRHD